MDDRWKAADAAPPEFHPLTKVAGFERFANWWQETRVPDFGGHTNMEPSSWAGLGLFQKALKGGPPVRLCSWEGNLVVPMADLLQKATDVFKLRPVRIVDNGNNNSSILLASDTTMISICQYERGRTASLSMATSDVELARKATELFKRCIVPDDPHKGLVFALTKNMNGYQLTRLGTAGTPLERGNYTPEVLQNYDHVVSDLKTVAPCGRLIILSGTPGTGKTFLVRALLTEVPQAAFVLIPPQMVADLGAPELLPALLKAKNEISGPIVLILEDGDKALVKRGDGDMNTISALLNLGDGILGSVLDIRILATTNAETLEMDPATRRKGRLCRHLLIEELPAERASQIVQRLTGQPHAFTGKTTLTEAYSAARDLGWKPEEVVPARPKLRPEIL